MLKEKKLEKNKNTKKIKTERPIVALSLLDYEASRSNLVRFFCSAHLTNEMALLQDTRSTHVDLTVANGKQITFKVQKHCEICINAKSTTKPFSKNGKRVETGKVFSYDIVGPMESVGVNGERYGLMMVHHESNATCVEPIGAKGDQASFIRATIKRILAKGFKLDTIVCDNIKENLSKELLEFYVDIGLDIYTSNQNSKAERRIRTLLDKTRCLLLDCTLHQKWWSHAIVTAAFLLNLTTIQNGKNCYEILHEKPCKNELFKFGANVLVQIKPTISSGKLGPRYQNAVFLGYSNNGYIVLMENIVLYSRDVRVYNQGIRKEITDDNDTDSSNDEIAGADNIHDSSEDNGSTFFSPEEADSDSEPFENPDIEATNHQQNSRSDISEDNNVEGKRARKQRQIAHVLFKKDVEIPKTYAAAMKWLDAIEEELSQLKKLDVFEVVDVPQGRHLMDSKLLFTVKTNVNQEVTRFKVRLVARGFTQIAGIDYSETYSSVASIAAIKSLIAMAVSMNCVIKQLDVNTAYLYASIDEELYMKIPACFPVSNKNQ
jgi:hypothetical protein